VYCAVHNGSLGSSYTKSHMVQRRGGESSRRGAIHIHTTADKYATNFGDVRFLSDVEKICHKFWRCTVFIGCKPPAKGDDLMDKIATDAMAALMAVAFFAMQWGGLYYLATNQ
jgi:hypothetical protein